MSTDLWAVASLLVLGAVLGAIPVWLVMSERVRQAAEQARVEAFRQALRLLDKAGRAGPVT